LTREVRAELLSRGWVTGGGGGVGDADLGRARAETLAALAAAAAAESAVVFNAVHGGCGEDGSLQALLAAAGVSFTGSGTASSQLCIDKVGLYTLNPVDPERLKAPGFNPCA
jgi:D-alanine-D-alanine ligase-like ATP-grasp enzyme